MLRVPELKAGEQPFDPAFARNMNPWNDAPAHTLAPGETQWGGTKTEEKNPEERVATLLNLAVVKDAVTQLHREEDEHMRRLEDFAAARICDIPAEHERFLREQTAAGENACKTEDQKNLFRSMTKTFPARSRARARSLQYRRAAEYWREAVERQNDEFLARAQRPENAVSDEAVRMYRDLILFNVENMLADAPEKERQEKLAAAAAAFRQKIIEKRLEIDPAGALEMTEAEESRRVLDENARAVLAEKAKQSLREAGLAAAAQAWADEGKPPEEAERGAQAQFSDGEERKAVLDRYHLARFKDNKLRLDARLAAVAAAWEHLAANAFDEQAIPAGIRVSDPALAECLRECLRRRGDAGGGAGRTDYARFMRFLTRFDRDGLWKTMEHLRAGERCNALLLAAGGPDAECWALAVRLLGGAAEPGDRELADALRIAWGAEGEGEGRSQEFMERFADALRRMEEKGALAVLDLVKRMESP